jgi:hypothetical protein
MLALQREARRMLIQTSGEFETSLIELAERAAVERGSPSIGIEHLQLAIRALAADNAAWRKLVVGLEVSNHVERCA